jgi:hypothetical protein
MARRIWVRLGQLDESKLESLKQHLISDVDEPEPERLKILAITLPDCDARDLLKLDHIGWGTLRDLVGWHYQSYPRCNLVKSFFTTPVANRD